MAEDDDNNNNKAFRPSDVGEGKLENHRDPALDPANEHRHTHHHHTAFAEKDREDEVVYSQGTTFDKPTIPDASPQYHSSFQDKDRENTDIEELGEGVTKRPWQRRLLKEWRHVVHAVIWLLFTG